MRALSCCVGRAAAARAPRSLCLDLCKDYTFPNCPTGAASLSAPLLATQERVDRLEASIDRFVANADLRW